MKKNEQIEEIATVIRNHSDKYNWNLFEFECKNLAIVLHNLGYRKIDDDCAVITKAELNQYKVQSVKEFAEKLKNNCSHYVIELNYITENRIDELLGEHKVEE